MLQSIRVAMGNTVVVPSRGARDPLVDFAFSLPGVMRARAIPGRSVDLVLVAADALGDREAFLHGRAFGRFRADDALELVLPLSLWTGAIRAGLARPAFSDGRDGETRVALLRPPRDGLETRAIMDLIETSWARARGL